MLFDTAKGFVPALVASSLYGDVAGVLAGGAAAVGHVRPVFLHFAKGGKAVATAGGVLFALAPVAGLIGAAVWLVTFAATRYASVASVVGSASLPLVAWLAGEPWPIIAFAGAAAIVVAFLHRHNISRLLAGTESRARPWREQLRGVTARAAPSSSRNP
jgi:glycerol-3-phosphate acyltransferase PlsY